MSLSLPRQRSVAISPPAFAQPATESTAEARRDRGYAGEPHGSEAGARDDTRG